MKKFFLRKSASSVLSKRVLRLTAKFVPAFANFNPGHLPLAATNREIRLRSSVSSELAEGTQKDIEVQVYRESMSALIFQL
ncbi:MAG: hypothetical protein HDR47_06225 [Bacteroides sp.]|nr:hypothetical protein [Bacteroides sp.]